LAEAFSRAGFNVQVKADYGRRSADLLPWIVHIGATGAFGGFFAALGADRYSKFKALVRDVREARRDAGNGTGAIDLRDAEGTNITLPSTLPDEALDALSRINWDEVSAGWLVWSSDRGEWVDHMKRDRP
jgi:hypothetical protein